MCVVVAFVQESGEHMALVDLGLSRTRGLH